MWKPAPQLSLSLSGFVQGLGVASGPVSDQAACCKCYHLVSDERAIAKKNNHGDMKDMTTMLFLTSGRARAISHQKRAAHLFWQARFQKL